MEKYQKVTREDYRKWLREEEKLRGDGYYSRGNNRDHGWGCGGNFGGALGADLGGKTEREAGKGDPFRLAFHLMPDRGWLNDPNGLCQKDGIYHIYYQYDPFDCEGDLKLWGHFTTENFVEYKAWEPALFPDSEADAHGVYSGSAFVEDGTIHFFYTGNVKYFDRPDYDYITAGRGSNTIRVTSSDGFHFSEKQLLMTTADYPSDISCHVRDPKIIKRNGTYYMVLGARDLAGRGLVLVYHSADLERWEYHDRIQTEVPFGYMWECPDLFELDGQLLLLCCPQGVESNGVDFQNVHQCVVMSLDYDFEKKECRWKALPGAGPALEASLEPEMSLASEAGLEPEAGLASGASLEPEMSLASEAERAGNGSLLPGIRQLDRGCDFYAPQTFCDENGRRILIGWMGIPDAGYTNPTTENGWQHALTLPRQLRLKNGKMIQTPLKELEGLRCSEERFTFPADCAACREEGSLSGCATGSLSAPAADSVIAADAGLCYEAELDFERCESLCLTLRRGVKLLYKKDNMDQNGKSETAGLLTLKLGQAGSGRPDRSVYLDGLKDLRIYSDASSLEIFVNGGEEVFTTRVYGTKPEWRIEGECRGTGRCFRLGTFKIEERKEHGCGE